MGSFIYLYQRTLINRVKKALKKPITYIYMVFIIGYIIMVGSSLGVLSLSTNHNTSENLAVILSILIFFLLPSNIISYSKRKGLLFRKGDIHFTFPAPVSPKKVIIFTGIKNLAINVVLAIVLVVVGLLYFEVNAIQLLLYAVLFVVIENVLESSMMILCYGNEVLPNGFFKVLKILLYMLMAVFILVAIIMLLQDGAASFETVKKYLATPVIQMIPVIGWNIALTRLIFIGPTMLNIVCTILFFLSALLLLILAYKVKCDGEYYEDAAKFADDYEQLRANKKKGIVSLSMGKKKKFKEAHVEYKGIYGKAIFYRQLLEYKKSRFFIFGWNSVLCLGLGVAVAVLAIFTDMVTEMGEMKIFLIPGLIAYIVFVFSGYATKWSRELENPYTYLIPDNSLRKMWHATKIEHIRGIVDGILITVPGAVVMELTPLQTILIIFLYVSLMANRLYYFMLADAIIGNTLGSFGRSTLKMFLQGIVIGLGIMGAVLGGLALGVEAGFAIMIVITLLMTFFGALGAATSFERMEVWE